MSLLLCGALSARAQTVLKGPSYHPVLSLQPAPPRGVEADLFACSAPEGAPRRPLSAKVGLFDSTLGALRLSTVRVALSCGMSARDTLSFSSISQGSAMLCLTRAVDALGLSLEPMELRVPYDESLCLYENLVCAFCLLVTTQLSARRNRCLEALPRRVGSPRDCNFLL